MSNLTYYCDNKRHLVSIQNLHLMADELNIKRCWFHNGNKPHYDIPLRRINEITAKCKIVSSKMILNIINEDFS